MKQIRLTESQFNDVVEALRFDDKKIVEASRLVLVDGCKQVEVAKQFDKKKQAVSAAISRILEQAARMGYQFFSITVRNNSSYSLLNSNDHAGVWEVGSFAGSHA